MPNLQIGRVREEQKLHQIPTAGSGAICGAIIMVRHFAMNLDHSGWLRHSRAEVRDHKTKGTSALTRFLYCGYASPKCRVSSFSSCPAFNQSPTKRMASKTNPVTLPRNIAIPRNMRRTPL